MPVLIGTSGWQYREWRGVHYPPGLAERDWLEYYAGRYGTVENNGTFYRLPATDTFAAWHAKVPGGFVMTVKASRYLTHIRRLRDPAEPVARLLRASAALGDRLGRPVLGGPARPSDGAVVAHGGLGLSALPRGRGEASATVWHQALRSWVRRAGEVWPDSAARAGGHPLIKDAGGGSDFSVEFRLLGSPRRHRPYRAQRLPRRIEIQGRGWLTVIRGRECGEAEGGMSRCALA